MSILRCDYAQLTHKWWWIHHVPPHLAKTCVTVYLDIFCLCGYCFGSIGSVKDLAVRFSTLSDTFDCSLVEIGIEGSLCEICGKLVSGNICLTLSLWELTLCSNNWSVWQCHTWSETWTLYDTGPVRSTTVTSYPLCTISKVSYQDRLSKIKVLVFTMSIIIVLLICLLFLNSLVYKWMQQVQSCMQWTFRKQFSWWHTNSTTRSIPVCD